MNDVSLFLLSIAGIFLLGALGEVVFQRTNVPDVIWLILAGILLGPLTSTLTREALSRIAPFFAAITLVVVLFEGGSALRLRELSRAAPRSSLLAVLTFAAATAVVCFASMAARAVGFLPAEWTLTHGLMLGAILGGSSSIIIMPAMAQARVEPRVANLVSLESSLTDAFCVVGTTTLIDIMMNGQDAAHGPGYTLARSFGIALVIGLTSGVIWLLFLSLLHSNEHAYPVTLAALLVLYVVVERLGGSAAFGILTFAIVLGNAKDLSAKLRIAGRTELDSSVRGFHRQMAFIVKSFFFVFIGAMLGPPWSLIAFGVALGVALLLARIPGVKLAMVRSDFSRAEKKLVTVSLPRGMAAGVLATLPASAGVPGTADLPVVVFACVFTTILIFAVGFPAARRAVDQVASQTSELALPAGAARPEATSGEGPAEVVPGGGAATLGDGGTAGSSDKT